ncbi:MAG: hypothetical protein IJV01_02335 [Bacteroidales bacterium]|nr:hypothetical protein [Bacteroidales bacterium]
MKKLAILFAALGLSLSAAAQPASQGQYSRNIDPKQKQQLLQSEKIAFLTAELELTPEEAQRFWPVYNKAQDEIKSGNVAFREAQKALRAGIQEGKDEKEVKQLLSAYIKARKERPDVMAKYAGDFEKAIGAKKTAKLYVSEEKFRQSQIHKLSHKGPQGQHPDKGQRPQPRPQGAR